SFLVTLTASDSRGGRTQAQFTVDVLLAGVPLAPADKEFAAPGQTVSADAEFRVNNVVAVLAHAKEASKDAAILVAVVPANLAAGLTQSFFIGDNVIHSAFDVRALGAFVSDEALVTFRYVSASDKPPTLTYFNKLTHQQEPVSADLYVVNVAQRTITILLGAD